MRFAETTRWIDSNQHAEKEEYEEKQKALEKIVLPILQSLGGGAGGASSSGPAESHDDGPKIEEID
jgi:L1 cell adhesion molecule like protein